MSKREGGLKHDVYHKVNKPGRSKCPKREGGVVKKRCLQELKNPQRSKFPKGGGGILSFNTLVTMYSRNLEEVSIVKV